MIPATVLRQELLARGWIEREPWPGSRYWRRPGDGALFAEYLAFSIMERTLVAEKKQLSGAAACCAGEGCPN